MIRRSTLFTLESPLPYTCFHKHHKKHLSSQIHQQMRRKVNRNATWHDMTWHTPREQSGPVQFWSQVQVLVSALWVPWPEHWSGHMALAISQLAPPQPGWQWHSPWIHTPWAEQLGSMQSTGDRDTETLRDAPEDVTLFIWGGQENHSWEGAKHCFNNKLVFPRWKQSSHPVKLTGADSMTEAERRWSEVCQSERTKPHWLFFTQHLHASCLAVQRILSVALNLLLLPRTHKWTSFFSCSVFLWKSHTSYLTWFADLTAINGINTRRLCCSGQIVFSHSLLRSAPSFTRIRVIELLWN